MLFIGYFCMVIVTVANTYYGLYYVSSTILSALHASTYLIPIRFLKDTYYHHPYLTGEAWGCFLWWHRAESSPDLQAPVSALHHQPTWFPDKWVGKSFVAFLYFEFLIDNYGSFFKNIMQVNWAEPKTPLPLIPPSPPPPTHIPLTWPLI